MQSEVHTPRHSTLSQTLPPSLGGSRNQSEEIVVELLLVTPELVLPQVGDDTRIVFDDQVLQLAY